MQRNALCAPLLCSLGREARPGQEPVTAHPEHRAAGAGQGRGTGQAPAALCGPSTARPAWHHQPRRCQPLGHEAPPGVVAETTQGGADFGSLRLLQAAPGPGAGRTLPHSTSPCGRPGGEAAARRGPARGNRRDGNGGREEPGTYRLPPARRPRARRRPAAAAAAGAAAPSPPPPPGRRRRSPSPAPWHHPRPGPANPLPALTGGERQPAAALHAARPGSGSCYMARFYWPEGGLQRPSRPPASQWDREKDCACAGHERGSSQIRASIGSRARSYKAHDALRREPPPPPPVTTRQSAAGTTLPRVPRVEMRTGRGGGASCGPYIKGGARSLPSFKGGG